MPGKIGDSEMNRNNGRVEDLRNLDGGSLALVGNGFILPVSDKYNKE